MHIRLWLILILIAHPFDTVGELFSRKSIIPDTSVDYLIVTPEVFEGNAARLARHRNAFKGDDVERADVIRLSELLSLHDSLFGNSGNSIPIYHKIREILQVFITTHFKNLRYIVFFGTDSIGWNGEKEHPESYGSMPSYIAGIGMDSYDTSNDTIIDYSDEFYILDTNGNDNGILPGIGRIPCATNEQADRYISKIIDFDNGIHDGPWRNKALLLADDAMKGEEIDPINYQHFDAAEGIDSLLDRQKYITSKVYLSAFRKDSYGIHREAGAAFLQRVGDGALWTVFFGHGNPGGLTNEGFITADMAEQLNNSGKPTIFISLSCQNGAFHLPTGQSMGKRFLFTLGGGALAYIASTNLEFSDANQTFMQEFFRIHDSLPNASIGTLMRLAKRRCTPNRLEYYHILGDPALVPVRKKHPIQIGRASCRERV